MPGERHHRAADQAPVTDDHGQIERLHQSLQDELLDVHGPFASLQVLQAALDAWRQEYNTDRPHQSLDMAFPASRFAPAVSPLPLRVPQLITASTGQAEPPSAGLAPWLLSRTASRRRRWRWKLTGSAAVGQLAGRRAAGLARPGAGGPEGHHLGG